MQPTLPEELRLLQQSVRQFVEEKLQPLEREIEAKDEISRPVIDAMAAPCACGKIPWNGRTSGSVRR